MDHQWIGYEPPASTLTIERSRLRFFAEAIGETNPIYLDPAAARAAGHADLPAPPTFLFAAELDSGAVCDTLKRMGLRLARILHGEQSFIYHKVPCAGDTITVRSRIESLYERRGGALEFLVHSAHATDQHGAAVADLRTVIVRVARDFQSGGGSAAPAMEPAGERLPPLRAPRVTRARLALFAGASGDHNPIHLDIDFARRAGFPDVFAQGMLSMAWLGRLLTNWAPQSRLRALCVRFQGVTHVRDAITCSGHVAESTERDGERCARVALACRDQTGALKTSGEALVALR